MTGFGLIGHLLEMLQYDYESDVCKVTPRDQKIAAQLVMKDIPTLTGIPSNTILLIHAHTYTYTHTDTYTCLLYTSPSPRDYAAPRMPSSA